MFNCVLVLLLNSCNLRTHTALICRWARVLGQEGCVHRGVSKEKICSRLRRPKFFSHRGVKIFFLRGVLLVDRGVILQKNDKK